MYFWLVVAVVMQLRPPETGTDKGLEFRVQVFSVSV